jgi:DNA-binding transcriptional ArsR family regulator
MTGDADIASAAALLAERARADLVLAVMEQGTLPAGELAARAGIAASTASAHLARLVDSGFLARRENGRQRYYELANPAVAEASRLSRESHPRGRCARCAKRRRAS